MCAFTIFLNTGTFRDIEWKLDQRGKEKDTDVWNRMEHIDILFSQEMHKDVSNEADWGQLV